MLKYLWFVLWLALLPPLPHSFMPPLASPHNRATPLRATSFQQQVDTQVDAQHLASAVASALIPKEGSTYPNPQVGCTIVSRSNKVLGAGFHPKAGWPHAEVFALFEAAKLVASGIDAASAVASGFADDFGGAYTEQKMTELKDTYVKEGATMFLACAVGATAYVTLEPCSHVGRTPPCCVALKTSGVSRVVVGTRDPNPVVNGGGIQYLVDAGLDVSVAESKESEAVTRTFGKRMKRVAALAAAGGRAPLSGAQVRELRAAAGRLKKENRLATVQLGDLAKQDGGDGSYAFKPQWLNIVDVKLWSNELVLVTCDNAVVGNKKDCEAVGDAICKVVDDCVVAQVIGRTILLHRPSLP
jgi:diaminohydroxyphosphoribosylaminopyrimidine deaminase/5-amino-6-(5-phosphoribosylamino)uracil reductase